MKKSKWMPSPNVRLPTRIAELYVEGRLWGGNSGSYTYPLTDADLMKIGEWSEDKVWEWIRKGAGDFYSVTKFRLRVGKCRMAGEREKLSRIG